MKIKANYPYLVGDIVDLYGERFYKNKDGELIAEVDEDVAARLIKENDCEAVIG